MSAILITYDLDDIVECRTRRRDGSHERGRITGVSSGGVEIEVINPRNTRQPKRRTLHYMRVGRGVGCLGNYRLVERADGSPVTYPKGQIA